MNPAPPPSCEGKNFVGGEGPLSAQVCVVGEAPGRREDEVGKPFFGPSGSLLNYYLGLAGLRRKDVRLENTFPFQPPSNKLDRIPLADRIPYANALLELLRTMPNLRMVVALGNYPLDLLRSGTARPSGKVKSAGLLKWRGTLLEGPTPNTILFPSVHPGFVLRMKLWGKAAEHDWKRIGEILNGGETKAPFRSHNIRPRISDLEAFLASLRPDDILSVDIERLKWEPHTSVIGFAKSPGESLVIPTTEDFWGENTLQNRVLPLVGEILQHPCPKGGQNFLFDRWWLRKDFGLEVANAIYDSRWMHHALDPRDRHSLDYLVSMYTTEPYFKEEGKVFIRSRSKATLSNLETFWVYNGLDCTTTREIFGKLEAELKERGLWEFYIHSYADLYSPLLDMMSEGILVDTKKMRELFTEFRTEVEAKQIILNETAKRNLLGKKDLSPKKLGDWLYGPPPLGLGLIQELNKETKKPTVDSTALRRLMGYYPDFKETGQLILDIRSKTKVAQALKKTRIDSDDRFRSTYSPSTITGRLASAKNPAGTGSNAQNIDRDLRGIFIPDPGQVFLEVDLSQAEDRVVKCLTGDPELLRCANLLPGELDVHSENAEFIFRTDRKLHDKKEWKRLRQIGKTVIHAGNYDQGPKTLQATLLDNGEEFTLKECKSLIQRAQLRLPQVVEWRAQTRIEVNQFRKLDNPFGREISFAYARMDDTTFRSAYAWRPQGTVGEIMNRWGVIPCAKFLKENPFGKLRAQVHDSVLCSVDPNRAFDLARFLADSLERPLSYRGVGKRRNETYSLTIPAEFKLGGSWATEFEFKRLPSRKEFTECAMQCLRKEGV